MQAKLYLPFNSRVSVKFTTTSTFKLVYLPIQSVMTYVPMLVYEPLWGFFVGDDLPFGMSAKTDSRLDHHFAS